MTDPKKTLAPCPFCGGRAETWVLETDGQYQGGCAVACAETPWFDTIDEVVVWWNRRPALEAAGGVVVPGHQERVGKWMVECFGPTIPFDKVERNDRFIEEALELTQATGYSAERAHALVDYVFSRPMGEPGQEVGGVMVTLAALCNVHEIDMNAEAKREVDRITQPDIVLKIRAKQAAKPTGSALPIAAALAAAPAATQDRGVRVKAAADKIVAALFKDLRGRRFLKWLFTADNHDTPIMHQRDGDPLMPLDADVQEEIARDWGRIILAALEDPSPAPATTAVDPLADILLDVAKDCAPDGPWSYNNAMAFAAVLASRLAMDPAKLNDALFGTPPEGDFYSRALPTQAEPVAAKADWERGVLVKDIPESDKPYHGVFPPKHEPVAASGEGGAVAWVPDEMVAAALRAGRESNMSGTWASYRRVVEAALAAHPAPAPDEARAEIERLTREQHETNAAMLLWARCLDRCAALVELEKNADGSFRLDDLSAAVEATVFRATTAEQRVKHAAEDEREACAKLADEAALAAQASVDRSDAKTTSGTSVLAGYVFAKTEAESIAKAIRARAALRGEAGDA